MRVRTLIRGASHLYTLPRRTQQHHAFFQRRASSSSTTTQRLPVLFLAEVHTRPAATEIVTKHISALKQRGYNTIMMEGIDQGNTLQARLNTAIANENGLNHCYNRSEAFKTIINKRYTLTLKQLATELEALEQQLATDFESLKLAFDDSTITIGDLLHTIFFTHAATQMFFHTLMTHQFHFINLDQHTASIKFDEEESAHDLTRRDTRYANYITNAFHAGHGIICILGANHLFPYPKGFDDIEPEEANREYMGDKLNQANIPHIGFFPFNSQHEVSMPYVKEWHKKTFPNHAPDPTCVYAIDEKQNFLDAVDQMIEQHKRMLSTNSTHTTARSALMAQP